MKPGDRVVCIEGYEAGTWDDFDSLVEGKTYTVDAISDNQTVSLRSLRTADGRNTWWATRRFEIVKPDLLEEFKTALDNLRADGYDVKVTLTKTITEEL